jgi:hypothetical protein
MRRREGEWRGAVTGEDIEKEGWMDGWMEGGRISSSGNVFHQIEMEGGVLSSGRATGEGREGTEWNGLGRKGLSPTIE